VLQFTQEQETAFFGKAPLLKGEDRRQYDELLVAVSGTVTPADIFELSFVRTIVNLIWETNRYRRLIGNMLAAAEQEALERRLRALLYGSDTPFHFDSIDQDNPLSFKSQALSRQYMLKQQAAIDEVSTLLASAGMDWEVIKAEAFSIRLREIESLNRMVAGAEARMKTTLREIDRHRKGLGQQLRRAVEQLDGSVNAIEQDRQEFQQAA
jgi:hypothetical protein